MWLKYETTFNEAESFIEQKLKYTTNPDSTLDKEEVYFEYKKWYKDTNQPIEDMLSQNEFSHDVLVFFGEDRIKTIYLDDRDESEAKDKRVRKPHWRYLTYKTQIGYRPEVIKAEDANTNNLTISEADIKAIREGRNLST